MALPINTIDQLRTYLDGVAGRANHHAPNVTDVALAVAGAVIWRADPSSIEVREYNGRMANMIWFTIGGNRYALVYNHQGQCIELRDRGQQGNVLNQFDNSHSAGQVRAVFDSL